jgi:hypothetical protein
MLPSALDRCTWTSSSCLVTVTPFAWTNWPEGRNTLLPPCELAVMVAGLTLASAWPDGLNSARVGRVKMLPAASRPSAVIPSRLLERIFPPMPKLLSRVPLALK